MCKIFIRIEDETIKIIIETNEKKNWQSSNQTKNSLSDE